MITPLQISNAGISIFGVAAFLLVLQDSTKLKKLGTILGIISNPFWWAMIIITDQWLTIPVHLCYTGGWIFNVYKLWFKKQLKD